MVVGSGGTQAEINQDKVTFNRMRTISEEQGRHTLLSQKSFITAFNAQYYNVLPINSQANYSKL